MSFMARPSYSETGKLLDGGLDLNMEAGLAEWVDVDECISASISAKQMYLSFCSLRHVKDAVILTSAVEVLAVFSRYFWLLWLVVCIVNFPIVWMDDLN